MKIGLSLPQGCDREFLGMDARPVTDEHVERVRGLVEAAYGSWPDGPTA